jgi:hypothetical protein
MISKDYIQRLYEEAKLRVSKYADQSKFKSANQTAKKRPWSDLQWNEESESSNSEEEIEDKIESQSNPKINTDPKKKEQYPKPNRKVE